MSLGTVKVKYDDGNIRYKDTNSELGLNLGIGTNLNLGGSIKPFAEFKFTISDFDQAVLFFGVKYDLK
ncbi:hypothetical protein [Fulvivirga imtechensis]|uniref:hypothetical protein n=1 Tax=Fulvivirga imtechensis TaxID=881893 RepID=UPI0026933AA0